MLLASVTSSVTSFVGNYGVYAVFLLMAVDAVFPAASFEICTLDWRHG